MSNNTDKKEKKEMTAREFNLKWRILTALSGKMGRKGKILAYTIIVIFFFGLIIPGIMFLTGMIGGDFNRIEGQYQIIESKSDDKEVGTWWHLSIVKDEDGKQYLAIYDNEAGNPGVEGEIVELTEDYIKIDIDQDYYDELPTYDWKQEGRYLELNYIDRGKDIELLNNDISLYFGHDEEDLDE